MTVQEIIRELTVFNEVFPRGALTQAIRQKDAVTPALLGSLDYACDNARELCDKDSDYFLFFYALYLLAQFREERAFPKIIRMATLEEDLAEWLIGDAELGAILCDTYNGDLPLLKGVIENDAIDGLIRGAALEAFSSLCHAGTLASGGLIDYLRELIAGLLAKEDLEEEDLFATMVADRVIDEHLIELIPGVRALFDRGAVDPMFFGEYDCFIDYLFDYGKPDKNHRHIDDTVAALESWGCFKQPAKQKAPKLPPRPAKPGRNDPCPCGSGKKYKKCCLAADEAVLLSAKNRDTLLEDYPGRGKNQDGTAFADHFSEEGVAVDLPVYKALHRRIGPRGNEALEIIADLRRIDLLLEGFEGFLRLCERDGLDSFAAYDEKHMVHYRAKEWMDELLEYLECYADGIKAGQKEYLPRVREIVERFG